MAKNPDNQRLDLGVRSGGKGSTYDPAADTDDTVTEEQLERVEVITGRRDDNGKKLGDRDPELDRELDKLAASTEEEVDALRVNLTQDAAHRDRRYGTGPIVDDLARERMAANTEVGKETGNRGAAPVAPGRDDTSSVLRRHRKKTGLARARNVVEGNLEETREESRTDRKVDEGTAA